MSYARAPDALQHHEETEKNAWQRWRDDALSQIK